VEEDIKNNSMIRRPNPKWSSWNAMGSFCIKLPLLPSLVALGFFLMPTISSSSFVATKAAAESCSAKLKILEERPKSTKSPKIQTRFSQIEVNSYLALDLSQKYHASLKSLEVDFEEGKLDATANIDFDHLQASSSKLMPKILGMLFSGAHTLTAQGKLISKNRKGFFQLEQAHFDNSSIPKAVIEEIITLVGRKQDPPFDPLQPAELPYGIEHVDVHAGYIVVFQ
jgi:hypothetical protein